jgi:hypothetical protein
MKTNTRGGKREGAGRKPSGTRTQTRSINLTPETWKKLDWLRGDISRSKFISHIIDRENWNAKNHD